MGKTKRRRLLKMPPFLRCERGEFIKNYPLLDFEIKERSDTIPINARFRRKKILDMAIFNS